MKLIPFSRDYCRDLINSGYSYFIIRQDQQRDEYRSASARVTYRAARNPATGGNVISIEELLNSLEQVRDDSYIMIAE